MNESNSEIEIVGESDEASEPELVGEVKSQETALPEEGRVEEAIDSTPATHVSPVEVEAGPNASPNDGLFLSPDDSDAEEVVDFEPEVDTARVHELEEKVTGLEAERDDFKNRMIRVAADLENFRKRTARERAEMRKYGIDRVVLELLPVLDNLERAITHGDTTEDPSGILDGVRMVERQLVTALQKHGVEGFESLGEFFDPTKHEAIQQVETSEHETGTVLEQYQKGYFLHDRLVRPAMVAVAKFVEAVEGAEASADDAGADADEARDDADDILEPASAGHVEDPQTGTAPDDESE